MGRKIDVFDGYEWEKIDSDDVFFNNINDVDEIYECYIEGDTLEVIFKSYHKPNVYYKKVNGVWGFPVVFK